VLSGRVLDAATAQPLVGASVGLNQTRGGLRGLEEKTDASGAFRFDGLAAGSFEVRAWARHYLPGEVGRRRPHGDGVWVTLAPSEHRDDLMIEMFKEATLSGRVADENGRPVANFSIEAWPRAQRPTFGYNAEPPIPSATTDARGTFHLTGMLPDVYVVVAPVPHNTSFQATPGRSPCEPLALATKSLARPGGTLHADLPRGLHQPKPLADGRAMTYRTQFFPGAVSIETAMPIALASGEARTGIDFQLRPVAATEVTGHVTGSTGLTRGGEVRLRLAGDPHPDGTEAYARLEPGSGAFTLLGLSPGSYTLEPTRYVSVDCDAVAVGSESKLTSVMLDVPPGGIDGLVVSLARQVQISGSVVLHGTSAPPRHIDLQFPSFDRSDRWPASAGDVTNLHMEIAVVPGSYELHASDNAVVPVWWLERVTVGGADATGRPITVGPDGLDGVVVTMTDRPSSVTGTVKTSTSEPVADASVVLFPTDPSVWTDARTGALRFQTSRALRGVYDFPSVPVGDYFLAALDERTMDEWPSAAFLGRIAATATPVTVKPGAALVVLLMLRR
jgi:hypothetical protein